MSTCAYIYRGYEIYFDPNPAPEKTAGGWSFVHYDYDYDGAPDSGDHRCGDGRSVSDCKQQIDEMEDEK